MTTHTKEVYRSRKAAGLCPACGKRPPVPGTAKCTHCRDQFRHYQKKYHDERRAQGLCLDCKKPVPTSNAYCPECIERRNGYRDRRVARFKEQGLCADCGKVPAQNNRTRCPQCLAKRRKGAAKYREQSPNYQIRARDGHACRICGRDKKLLVHHIDGHGHTMTESPNDSPDNLITLCRGCHSSLTKLAGRRNAPLALDLLASLIKSRLV